MLIFKTLKWSNAFSYGPDNKINFTSNPIVQLVGKNGHGKSSIALILEEVLYNKNSKGVKKGSILNRYVSSKSYSIELEFEKDGVAYSVKTVRGSTQTVQLFKDGVDISGHTSTTTYKLIEQIIGYDHKTFCQIVYQSSAFSLEFLTATDTNRKKFLIDLLGLNRYSDIAQEIKTDLAEAVKDADKVQASVNIAENWLAKNAKIDITILQPRIVPESPTDKINELTTIKAQISNIDATNKRIRNNNTYKELTAEGPPNVPPAPTSDIIGITVALRSAEQDLANLEAVVNKNSKLPNKCPSCGQAVDNSHKQKMVEEAKEAIPRAKALVEDLSSTLKREKALKDAHDAAQKKLVEWENNARSIDKTLPDQILDINVLSAKSLQLNKEISEVTAAINEATKYNRSVEENNTRMQVILSQRASYEEELTKFRTDLAVKNAKVNTLQLLSKTFSPSGLIAYKIETLVKDLEDQTNKYLADMSDGRFQLFFRVNSSDKLDVVITDNGEDIDIFALSNGELARVNISTLLAIRKLMQSLSNSRTNLLILDETVESLDLEGKEKLIEVLLAEDHLNTVLVSHGFTHPLLQKVEIVKTDNISRIE